MERQAPLLAFGSLIAWFYAQTDGFEQTDILRYCTMKSAPIFMLALISYAGEPYLKHKLRTRCALGLAFGGIGDFLLSTNELGFHFGTISFALGHIFYIAYFGTFLRELSYGVSAFSLLYAISVNHFFIIPFLWHSPLQLIILCLYSFVITAAVVVSGSLAVNGSIHEQKGKVTSKSFSFQHFYLAVRTMFLELTFASFLVYISLIWFFFLNTNGFKQTDVLRYCTMKSAPIFSLALFAQFDDSYFIDDKLRTRLVLGLVFGGIGDFLLSSSRKGFYFGAISFAIGHLCYIVAVNHLYVVPFYKRTLFRLITLYVYSFIIGSGVVVAASLFLYGSVYGQNGSEFRTLLVGYLIFSTSDTLLLFEHLGDFKVPYRRAIILFTYYLAQFLIFNNAVNVARSID
ncbi:YhhN-like protein [Aphelenchoides besseyi]|nr:YhhN-like protein [Aphelenchoides besseyi]